MKLCKKIDNYVANPTTKKKKKKKIKNIKGTQEN